MKDLSVDFYSYCHNAMNTINPQFMNYSMPNNNGSIFNNPNAQNPQLTEAQENTAILEQQLQAAKDEQGFIGKTWDGIKNFFGAGSNSKKATEAVEKYKRGEMSFDDAQAAINKFSSKQKSSTNIFTNVLTGLGTAAIIAATGVATGGLSLAVIGAGALAGGAIKATLKTADRATNNIEGDALNAKQIVKDGLSGAIDGAVTVATCGVGKTVTVLGSSAKEAAKIGIKEGIKSGAIAGAATGAGNYTLDAVFEDDVKFSLEGLAGATIQNAAAGALVGGVAGGVTNVKAYNKATSLFNNGAKGQMGDVVQIGNNNNIIEIDANGNVLELPSSTYKTLPPSSSGGIRQGIDDVIVIDDFVEVIPDNIAAMSGNPSVASVTGEPVKTGFRQVLNNAKAGVVNAFKKGAEGFKNLFKGFKPNAQPQPA